MIDVLSTFPEAYEKNRRTNRGHKPIRYLANAPSLKTLLGKIYTDILVYHSEVYRGYKRYWYLVRDSIHNRYGYINMQEPSRSPFEVNCSSIEVLRHMCQNIDHQTVWNTSILELVRQVAHQLVPGSTKGGTNFDFIEMVKNKFPEHFAPPPEIKPINKFNSYYSFDKNYRKSQNDPYSLISNFYDDTY